MRTPRNHRSRPVSRFTWAVAIASCAVLIFIAPIMASTFWHLEDYSTGGETRWVKILVYSPGSAYAQARFTNGSGSSDCRAESWVDGGSAGVDIDSGNCAGGGATTDQEDDTRSWCGYVVAVTNFWEIPSVGAWIDKGQGLGSEVWTLGCP